MSPTLVQSGIAAAIVGGAVAYLMRLSVRAVARFTAPRTGCGSACGCETAGPMRDGALGHGDPIE